MRVVFVSNYMTHHQLPFCRRMNEKLGEDFCFIETEQMAQDRIDLGWQLEESRNINIIKSYVNDKMYQGAYRMINEADAVIIGGTRDEYISQRLRENKLIFRYEERIFKKSWLKLLNIHTLYMIYTVHVRNQKKNVYMLCAGAYLPQELKVFHIYKDRMFKWGYFPETHYYEINELMRRKHHETAEILWCARFIDWKHPEKVIRITQELKKQRLRFHITMIGNGKLRELIEKEVWQKGLEKYISVLGSIPSKNVRKYMEEADIFLATSDRNEGWGAVVNEAMNSGCAVVADKMMGAVPWLIQSGENGYAYKKDKECISYLSMLIQDEEKRREIGIKAYRTIAGQWNAEKAADNLLYVIEGKGEVKGPGERL